MNCSLIFYRPKDKKFDWDSLTQLAEKAGVKFIHLRSKLSEEKTVGIRGYQGIQLRVSFDGKGVPRFQYNNEKTPIGVDICSREAVFYKNPIDNMMYCAIPDTPFNRVKLTTVFMSDRCEIVDEPKGIYDEIHSMYTALSAQHEIEQQKRDLLKEANEKASAAANEADSLRRQLAAAKEEAAKLKELTISMPMSRNEALERAKPAETPKADYSALTPEKKVVEIFTAGKKALMLVDQELTGTDLVAKGYETDLLKVCRKVAKEFYGECRTKTIAANKDFVDEQRKKFKVLAHSKEYCEKIPQEIDRIYLEGIKQRLTEKVVK